MGGRGHRSVLSGSDGVASDQLVDDGVEGVEAGGRAARGRASRRRPGSRPRRRTGRGRSAAARPSRRRRRTRPGASRATPRPGSRRPRGRRRTPSRGCACDDPPGEVGGGARRPVALRAAVPLEQVRIERVERPEQRDGGLDQPAEEGDAEAEVRGGDRRRAVLAQQRSTRGRSAVQPVVAMTNRRQPASSAAARFGHDGVRPRGLDDEIRRRAQVGRIVAPRRPAEHEDVGRALAGPSRPFARRPPRPRGRARRRRG